MIVVVKPHLVKRFFIFFFTFLHIYCQSADKENPQLFNAEDFVSESYFFLTNRESVA